MMTHDPATADLIPLGGAKVRFIAGARPAGVAWKSPIAIPVDTHHAAPACPDADVIILTLNRLDESLAAIASALGQTGVTRHVHVLDQGSSGAELACLARTVEGRPDASLYQADRNLGVGGGRNVLAALGHARVIAALDNDATFADATTLGRMVRALEDEPDLAAIGCRILRAGSATDDLSSWGYPRTLLPRAGGRFDTTTFVGAGHAIRRTAWNAAGGYDANLFFCWEEYDFCLRAIALGWRIHYRGDIVIHHAVAAEQRQAWSDRRWFHFVRNRLHLERKHAASWFDLAPRIAGYLVKGARHRLLGATLRAITAAARMPMADAGTGSAHPPMPLPAHALAYLERHDRAHRGGWWRRWRVEVLAGLAPQPNRARASRAMTAGLSSR